MEGKKSNLDNLTEDYNKFHNSLKDMGYSQIERGIVYSGLALGMFVPPALTRYGIFPETSDNLEDLKYWAFSVTINVMSSAILRGFPLAYSAGLGALGGIGVAFPLKKFRERNKEQN